MIERIQVVKINQCDGYTFGHSRGKVCHLSQCHYFLGCGTFYGKNMAELKGRALHVIGSMGIVRFAHDEKYRKKTAEIDIAALRSVNEADLLRCRNCGPKTAPVVMEYINTLREILL